MRMVLAVMDLHHTTSGIFKLSTTTTMAYNNRRMLCKVETDKYCFTDSEYQFMFFFIFFIFDRQPEIELALHRF